MGCLILDSLAIMANPTVEIHWATIQTHFDSVVFVSMFSLQWRQRPDCIREINIKLVDFYTKQWTKIIQTISKKTKMFTPNRAQTYAHTNKFCFYFWRLSLFVRQLCCSNFAFDSAVIPVVTFQYNWNAWWILYRQFICTNRISNELFYFS